MLSNSARHIGLAVIVEYCAHRCSAECTDKFACVRIVLHIFNTRSCICRQICKRSFEWKLWILLEILLHDFPHRSNAFSNHFQICIKYTIVSYWYYISWIHLIFYNHFNKSWIILFGCTIWYGLRLNNNNLKKKFIAHPSGIVCFPNLSSAFLF